MQASDGKRRHTGITMANSREMAGESGKMPSMTDAALLDLAPEAAPAAPVIKVRGEPLSELPQDLYIPPDALAVFLDAFEGPLDLLLYLIRKQNLDVLDIPMAALTKQYMAYVEAARATRLELAAEYLLMTAMLIDIKSRMLLPRREQAEEAGEGEDPQTEQEHRLLEYEQMKLAGQHLDALPQAGRDFDTVSVFLPAAATRLSRLKRRCWRRSSR